MLLKKAKNFVPPTLAVLMLLVFVCIRPSRVEPGDVEPYHARIRAAVANVDFEPGNWVSTETEVPTAAVSLLAPNVIISRRFTNTVTGEFANALLVQCRDGRDMLGHYPPSCYPAQGWTLTLHTPQHWDIDGIQIPGMEYQFRRGALKGLNLVYVNDFFILPNGSFTASHSEVRLLIKRYPDRYYGAGQMQILTDGNLNIAERREIVCTIIKAYLPVIQAIRSKPNP